jgi:hypothetical protein
MVDLTEKMKVETKASSKAHYLVVERVLMSAGRLVGLKVDLKVD